MGWTAQYELYDTSLQEPELVEEWKFKLEPIEVTQQIQTFSKIVDLDPTDSGNRSTGKDLAIHFPVSIGNKLDIFTVLRRVYIRKRCGKTSSLDPCESTSSWIILSIPIEHCEHSTLLDCSSLSSSREESSEADTQIPRPTFVKIDNLTCFRLVAHNDYLLYYAIRDTSITRRPATGAAVVDGCDRTTPAIRVSSGSQNSHCSFPWPENLLNGETDGDNNQSRKDKDDLQITSNPGHDHEQTYDVEHTGDDERTDDDEYSGDEGDEIDGISTSDHSDDVPENECMATSVAVFSLAGVRQGEQVRVLDYLENAGQDKYIGRCAFHPELPLMAIHCGSESSGSIVLWNFRSREYSEHVSETVPRLQILVEATMHWTESLNFSVCGTQVIIEEYLVDRPTVIPVHESNLYFMARELKDLLGAADPTLAEGEAHSLPLANTVTVPQNDTILLDAEHSIRLDFHPNQVQKDIELVHSSGRSKTMQPLLTLPDRSEMRHVNVSLLPPRDMDMTRIRIMMTKAPKLFCTLADANEDISTSIVEKETRALHPARQREHVLGNFYSWGHIRTTALGGLTAFHSANMIQVGNKKQRISQ